LYTTMFVNVFAAVSTAPIATLTYTRNGRKYSESFSSGGIVGFPKDGCVVRMVNQFPKLISPAGEDFLVNGMTVRAGRMDYKVSGVKIHKLCYMAEPYQNRAFREQFNKVQEELIKEAQVYWKELDKYITYFRANRASGDGHPDYVNVMEELGKICKGEFVVFNLRKPETKNAIDALENVFSDHAIVQGGGSYGVPSKRKTMYVDFSTFSAHASVQEGKSGCAPSFEKSTELHLAAVKFFEFYRKYMAVFETLKVNRSMEQKPLFELLNKDITRTSTKKVYEGERFGAGCSGVPFTARSVCGFPVAVPAWGRSSQILLEGGYFKVEANNRYADYGSDNEEPETCVSPTTLFYVSGVNTPMGIDPFFDDPFDGKDAIVARMLRDAHQSVIDRHADSNEEWRQHLVRNLVSLRERVETKAARLDSSDLLPSAKQILLLAHRGGPAIIDSEESLSQIAGLYSDLMRECGVCFEGSNCEAYFIASAVRGYHASVQALRRAEAQASSSATA